MTKSDDRTPVRGLDPEIAQLVESLYQKLDEVDLFTLLNVDLNADTTLIRRGYFARSRIFHPDRYFSRNLGEHKRMLERVFAYATAAYDFLKDDRRRAAYRRQILASRDSSAGVVTAGARVIAVETDKGLRFEIADEEAFFDSGEQRPESATFEGADGDVKLPKKRYALPRIKKKRDP